MSTETRNDLRGIMTLAWQLVKHNGLPLADALKVAWLNDKLRSRLTNGITKFYYRKIDGSIREAHGTLKTELLPSTVGSNRRKNDTVQTYYDTELQEWRCYRKANLVMVSG